MRITPKNKPNEVPELAKHPKYKSIGSPFKHIFIRKNVYKPKTKKQYKTCETMNFDRALERHPSTRAKYMLVLLHIGFKLQEAVHILETERRVDVRGINEFCVLGLHPLIKTKSARLSYEKNTINNINDENFLIWRSVLTDYLLQVSEHVREFSIMYNLSLLPTYDDLKVSTSQERPRKA